MDGAPLVAKRAGHVDVADGAVAQMLNGFDHAGVGARLAAVLANAIVLLDRAHQLTSFKRVMRAGLFDVDVLAGLAGPDGHERVPMIGRGDGNGVDLFVLEQLAHIDVGFWPGQAHLFDFADALARNVFVDIAERGELGLRDVREAADMIVAAAAHSADGHADAIVRAENLPPSASAAAPAVIAFPVVFRNSRRSIAIVAALSKWQIPTSCRVYLPARVWT